MVTVGRGWREEGREGVREGVAGLLMAMAMVR